MTLENSVDKELPAEAMGTEDPGKDDPEFYDKAKKYWSGVKPTLDGVLGGFGHISQSDVSGSKDFLNSIFRVSVTILLCYLLIYAVVEGSLSPDCIWLSFEGHI